MDKKKLQNFIAQLQTKSQTYNAAADNPEASESTEACKTFTEDYVITDSEKELFKFGNLIEDGSFYEDGICLDFEHDLYGQADYKAFIQYRKVLEPKLISLELMLLGRTISHHESFDVYSKDTGEFIYTGYSFQDKGIILYPVNLTEIYKKTGSVNFKIKVNEDFGSESFFTHEYRLRIVAEQPKSIKITAESEKSIYSINDIYDKSAIAFTAEYADGTLETVNSIDKFTITPNDKITAFDNKITVTYKGISAFIDILVLADNWNEELERRNYKDVYLCSKVTGFMNLNNGGFTAAFNSFDSKDLVVPINISHIHRRENPCKDYGAGWRLSLNKSLKLSDDDTAENTVYTYEDEAGDSYRFTEKYYIIENTEKVFLNKNDITIDINGALSYNGKPVYKCQSCGGYTLLPEINDFINCEFLEQKQSKQIELEEIVNSYESSLKNYVCVLSGTGEIVQRLNISDNTSFKNSIKNVSESEGQILMTENEALQLKSLYFSLNQTQVQIDQQEVQPLQFDLETIQGNSQSAQYYNQLCDSYNAIDLSRLCEPEDYNKSIDFSLALPTDEKQKSDRLSKINAQIAYERANNNINWLADSESGYSYGAIHNARQKILNVQKKVFAKQEKLLKSQLLLISSQINFLIEQATKNRDIVVQAFNKYMAKKAELQILLRQTPVNYVKDENGVISGFNKNGNLVCVFDSFNNYVAVELSEQDRITGVYDNRGKTMHFEYSANLLQSITGNLGRTVKYGYDANNNLISVDFADGVKVEFEYENGSLIKAEQCSSVISNVSYGSENRVTQIQSFSQVYEISKNTYKKYWGSPKKLSEVQVVYEDASVKIIGDNSREIYTFYPGGRVLSHCVNANGLETTEYYCYFYNDLNQKSVKSFTEKPNGEKTAEYQSFNKINLLVAEKTDWQSLSDELSVKTEVEYQYDLNGNLTKEVSAMFSDNNGEITQKISYVIYFYNAAGLLTLTESYTDGEELTLGKSYRKTFYNDNGVAVKTVSWNSLDSSSKFYSESAYAENGQITSVNDETGENSQSYSYENDTNILSAITYANGSTLAYGANPFNGEKTSVTQSDEYGESNSTNVIYCHGLPVEVKSGNTVINYEYDYKRRKTAVLLNGELYERYSYDNSNLNYDSTDKYIKDVKYSTVKDKRGNLKYINCNNKRLVTYTYDNLNRLLTCKDEITSQTASYVYNGYNKLESYSCGGINEDYNYNIYGELAQIRISGDVSHTYNLFYKNNSAKNLDYIAFAEHMFKPLYDVNGRNIGKEIYNAEKTKIAAEYVSYRKQGDRATNMPSSVKYSNGSSVNEYLQYKYDKMGNITQILKNGALTVRYLYDNVNRLIREDNKQLNKTWLYAYDGSGNIISKRQTNFTLIQNAEEQIFTAAEYGYNGDILKSYNGQNIEYNEYGSPVIYRDSAAEWLNGTALSKYKETTFTYDGTGKRLSKNAITYVYDREGRLIKQSNGLEYFYDHTGICGIIYGGEIYFYRKDVQGNILAIIDKNGASVVEYKYDAWGNHIVEGNAELGEINPFRYRGYYYDTETGLYYLKTRYYDPETGRFISQDSLDYAQAETINGLNLYAYCGSNPVMYIDPNGTAKWWEFVLWGLGLIAGLAIGVVASVLSFGAATPFAAIGYSILAGAFFSFVGAAAVNITSQIVSVGWDNVDAVQPLIAGTIGMVASVITSGLALSIGAIAIEMGTTIGYSISKMVIGGLEVSKVYSTSMLMGIGGVIGNILGTLGTTIFSEYLVNSIFNKSYDSSNVKDSIISIIINQVLEFCNLLIKT